MIIDMSVAFLSSGSPEKTVRRAHLCNLDKDMGSGRHGAGIRSTSPTQQKTKGCPPRGCFNSI